MIASALAIILTAYQVNALNIAYNEGQKYGIPIYTQAVILVESSACLHRRGDDGRSLGCGQLQVSTAVLVCGCKVFPGNLERNNALNLKISARFLAQCFARFFPDKDRAILAYNIGIPAAAKATNSQVKHSKYIARVLYWVRRLHEIRTDND